MKKKPDEVFDDHRKHKVFEDDVPGGATRKAFDREENGGVTPGSPIGDRHAQGDTMGGTEYGGLAGSNVGEGAPINDEDIEADRREDEEGPFAGFSGGAVGGTPAEGRATGGQVHGGFSPGSGASRGDSTLGSSPDSSNKQTGKKRKKK